MLERNALKFCLLLINCNIFTNASTDFGISSENVSDSQLGYISNLSNSLVHIINFNGHDINLSILYQPVVLLQYNTLGENVMPVEFWRKSYHNKSAHAEKFAKYLDYVGILFEESHLRLERNLNSETIIYLHPPNQETSPIFYQEVWWSKHRVLKDPFRFEINRSKWKLNFLNTVPKLSALICTSGYQYTCKNEYHKEVWVSSVAESQLETRFIEIVQIWETLKTGEHLSMLCSHCNPCKPLEMVQISRTMLNTDTLFYHNNILNLKSRPRSIRVILHDKRFDLYGNINERGAKARKALLNHISKLDFETEGMNFLPHSIDKHALELLFPENITYQKDWNVIEEGSSTIFVEECSKEVNHLSGLIIVIGRHTEGHLGHFPEIGLIFRRDQLRFVSCHKERSHWITQLRELVFVFDAATWLLTILMTLVFVRIYIYTSQSQHKNYLRQTSWDACFWFSASLIDQSTHIFQSPEKGRILLFWLPLMLLILNNQYKGDNITNLTAQLALVPFDTFDKLLDSKFDIRSRRLTMPDFLYGYLKYNINRLEHYVPVNSHEAFPTISELWQRILMRFRPIEYTSLAALKDRISDSSRFYLNHSQMMPEWMDRNEEQGGEENIERILSLHMNKCHKTAMILPEFMALQLFTIFKIAKMPAFYGEDVIHENLLGYIYEGYIPNHILRRIKFSFSSGIIEWWQKYLKWFMTMKIKHDYEQNQGNALSELSGDQNESKLDDSISGAYVLSLIPVFGFALAIAVFTCYDCQALKASFECFGTVAKTFIRKPNGKDKVCKIICASPSKRATTRPYNNITCPLCSEMLSNTDNSLKHHFVDFHAEHFFMHTLISNEKNNEIPYLTTLILNSEIELLESDGHQNADDKLRCPYGCDNINH